MAEPGATPSHQLFAGFNAFFSSTWQKTRVEQVSLKVFHLWRILGHPKAVHNVVGCCHFKTFLMWGLPMEMEVASELYPDVWRGSGKSSK